MNHNKYNCYYQEILRETIPLMISKQNGLKNLPSLLKILQTENKDPNSP